MPGPTCLANTLCRQTGIYIPNWRLVRERDIQSFEGHLIKYHIDTRENTNVILRIITFTFSLRLVYDRVMIVRVGPTTFKSEIRMKTSHKNGADDHSYSCSDVVMLKTERQHSLLNSERIRLIFT